MIRALFSAGSGMMAQQMNVDNIAHNLANANTVGFKMRRTQFQDLLYQNFIQPGAAAGSQTIIPTGLQLGLGTRPVANEIIFSQGNFSLTNNPLDLVIQGRGMFQVRLPSGELAFTRAGIFTGPRRQLITAGEIREPQITLPRAQSITIASDGTAVASSRANRGPTGQGPVARFRTPPAEQHGPQPVRPPTPRANRPSPILAARGAARCCRATSAIECQRGGEFINLIVSQRAYEEFQVVRADGCTSKSTTRARWEAVAGSSLALARPLGRPCTRLPRSCCLVARPRAVTASALDRRP
jgi:flagellar basal-body rod protein FlgG